MKPSHPVSPVEALTLPEVPAPEQLDNIKAHLDLVLLALEALAGIGSEAMLQAAAALELTEMLPDRVALWRLRQANPLRKSQGGRKKLDVDEARALVLISSHLATQHQELIRRAVALLEQMAAQGQAPYRAALLGDYLDRFSNTYQERMEAGETVPPKALSHLALKLLIDLLFYSGPSGSRRLWLSLLDRAKSSLPPPKGDGSSR
ncbi:DUF3038 domain-containing protein [Trichothermofontia sp.]